MPIDANRGHILIVAAFYLASSFVHNGNRTIFPGLPRLLSGDSRHYLVVVNSLIEDGDFDVSNKYCRGRAGGLDFGRRSPPRHWTTIRRWIETE